MTQAPHDLHSRLHTAAPSVYPLLDLATALQRGRRTVHRRRVGTLVMTAVAVAVIAVGSTVLAASRHRAALVPADPSRVLGYVSYSVATEVSGVSHDYLISVLPAQGGRQTVEYAVESDGLKTFARSEIDLTTPRVTWGYPPGGYVVLGVIPSASVRDYMVESSGGGGSVVGLKAIPGTGYTAFAQATEKPLVGEDAVRDVLWFNGQDRPVTDGHVGSVAGVDGYQVWMSADRSMYGYRDENGGTSREPLSGPLPTLFSMRTSSPLGWRLAVLVPAGAVSGTATLVDGTVRPFTSTPLGDRRVFGLTGPAANGSVGVTEVRWYDSSGTAHTLSR